MLELEKDPTTVLDLLIFMPPVFVSRASAGSGHCWEEDPGSQNL